jgi:hypothetical protein
LANKTIVVSFYARAGANYSPTSSALSVRFYTGTGTDQSGLGSAFTGSATPISQTATLTTSWQRFQYTATLASTTTQVQLLAFATPTGTAGAADYFDITGLQVELGAVATPFSRSGGTIQGELAACQRYFERLDSTNGTTFAPFGTGQCVSTTSAFNTVTYTIKRVSPSFSFATAGSFQNTGSNGAGVTLTAISAAASSVNAAIIQGTVASGLVAGDGTILYRSASASAYIDISAEL